MVEEYRDSVDAREALRESDILVSDIAGTAHASISAYQLSDPEFDEAFPSVTFKDWLIARRDRRREARDE